MQIRVETGFQPGAGLAKAGAGRMAVFNAKMAVAPKASAERARAAYR